MSLPRPSVAALLEKRGPTPAPTASVAELRALWQRVVVDRLRLVRDHGPLAEVRDLDVAGVPVRLYRAHEDAERTDGAHVHLHGGGWWMGGIATVDAMCRELAHELAAPVLSVDYRLAPEHPYPAGLVDVDTVLDWALNRWSAVSLGGESAGANLAVAATLRRRDRGAMLPTALWLDVPVADLAVPDDASVRAYGTGYGLEVAQLPVVVAWYGGDVTDPLVSPLHADLSGLPPTLVTTAELDPLREQGRALAQSLLAAGVPTEQRCAAGHVHGSSWYTALDEGTAAWHEEVVAIFSACRAAAVMA